MSEEDIKKKLEEIEQKEKEKKESEKNSKNKTDGSLSCHPNP